MPTAKTATMFLFQIFASNDHDPLPAGKGSWFTKQGSFFAPDRGHILQEILLGVVGGQKAAIVAEANNIA